MLADNDYFSFSDVYWMPILCYYLRLHEFKNWQRHRNVYSWRRSKNAQLRISANFSRSLQCDCNVKRHNYCVSVLRHGWDICNNILLFTLNKNLRGNTKKTVTSTGSHFYSQFVKLLHIFSLRTFTHTIHYVNDLNMWLRTSVTSEWVSVE